MSSEIISYDPPSFAKAIDSAGLSPEVATEVREAHKLAVAAAKESIIGHRSLYKALGHIFITHIKAVGADGSREEEYLAKLGELFGRKIEKNTEPLISTIRLVFGVFSSAWFGEDGRKSAPDELQAAYANYLRNASLWAKALIIADEQLDDPTPDAIADFFEHQGGIVAVVSLARRGGKNATQKSAPKTKAERDSQLNLLWDSIVGTLPPLTLEATESKSPILILRTYDKDGNKVERIIPQDDIHTSLTKHKVSIVIDPNKPAKQQKEMKARKRVPKTDGATKTLKMSDAERQLKANRVVKGMLELGGKVSSAQARKIVGGKGNPVFFLNSLVNQEIIDHNEEADEYTVNADFVSRMESGTAEFHEKMAAIPAKAATKGTAAAKKKT